MQFVLVGTNPSGSYKAALVTDIHTAAKSTQHISVLTSARSPRDSSQLNREGCPLASNTPDGFVISGEKRKKKILKRVGGGAVCCCLPFYNNVECISGHWHFHIMAKDLLYQTTCHSRLICLLPCCSRALRNQLSPWRRQRRPLRETENSHTG